MYQIVNLFFNICLFKKGPQDVPYSSFLLLLTIVAYTVIGFLILHLSSDLITTIQQLFVEVLLALVIAWAILSLFNKSGRYYQTVTALFGTDALISLMALPVMSNLVTAHSSPVAVPAVLLIMLWHLLVTAHIFRHALSVVFSMGLGLAVIYLMASYWVMEMLFPSVVSAA